MKERLIVMGDRPHSPGCNRIEDTIQPLWVFYGRTAKQTPWRVKWRGSPSPITSGLIGRWICQAKLVRLVSKDAELPINGAELGVGLWNRGQTSYSKHAGVRNEGLIYLFYFGRLAFSLW